MAKKSQSEKEQVNDPASELTLTHVDDNGVANTPEPDDLGELVDGDIEPDEAPGFPEVIENRQKYTKPDPMIARLVKTKTPHFIRRGSECTEIILQNTKFIFTSVKNFPRAKLFLFNNVKRDVLKWIGNRSDITLPPAVPTEKLNLDYDDSYGEITGTDLNHAYWRIAFAKGMISEKTYEHGLVPDNTNVEGKIKALRLATLSVLGREKKFTEFDDQGNPVREHITQKEDPLRKKVFLYIRLYCYNMMHDLSIALGDDFESWKVDCIYYRDTPENRKIVWSYFERRNMTFKQLDYFEPEPQNEVE